MKRCLSNVTSAILKFVQWLSSTSFIVTGSETALAGAIPSLLKSWFLWYAATVGEMQHDDFVYKETVVLQKRGKYGRLSILRDQHEHRIFSEVVIPFFS